MKSILDPAFRYVSAAKTDIRRTFARIRREQKEEAAKAEALRLVANVEPIKRRKA